MLAGVDKALLSCGLRLGRTLRLHSVRSRNAILTTLGLGDLDRHRSQLTDFRLVERMLANYLLTLIDGALHLLARAAALRLFGSL